MKLKMKLDKAKLQKHFETHGEKLIFGVLALAAILVCYYGFAVKPYTVTPQEMMQHADTFKKNIDVIELPTIVNKDLTAVVTAASRTIVGGPALKNGPLNPPLIEGVTRREEPRFFAPIELIATATWGAVAFKDKTPEPEPEEERGRPRRRQAQPEPEPSATGNERTGFSNVKGTRPVGKQWIVVTGAVPVKEQADEYVASLSNSSYPEKNFAPNYKTFRLQRAIVGPTGAVAENAWQDVDPQQLNIEKLGWFKTAEEPVNREVIDPAFTAELPPLMTKQNDLEIVGHPRVTDADGNPVIEEPAEEAAEAPAEDAAVAANPPGREAAPDAAKSRGSKESISYKLFRYLDFAVQPNQTYRYRVKLILENPNVGVPVQYLASPELNQGPTRETPFSEPTGDVKVPALRDFYAGTVKQRANDFSKWAVTVIIRQFDPEKATFVSKELPTSGRDAVRRGKVANLAKAEVSFLDPATSKPQKDTIPLRTDTLVLDMSGGAQIEFSDGQGTPKKVRAPSEVLVVDGLNVISVKRSLADARSIEMERKEAARAAEPAPRAAAPAEPMGGAGNPALMAPGERRNSR